MSSEVLDRSLVLDAVRVCEIAAIAAALPGAMVHLPAPALAASLAPSAMH